MMSNASCGHRKVSDAGPEVVVCVFPDHRRSAACLLRSTVFAVKTCRANEPGGAAGRRPLRAPRFRARRLSSHSVATPSGVGLAKVASTGETPQHSTSWRSRSPGRTTPATTAGRNRRSTLVLHGDLGTTDRTSQRGSPIQRCKRSWKSGYSTSAARSSALSRDRGRAVNQRRRSSCPWGSSPRLRSRPRCTCPCSGSAPRPHIVCRVRRFSEPLRSGR